VRWLALVAALFWGAAAYALDSNDRLVLTLDGGEQVDGWFVRAEANAVVLSVPGVADATRVPLDIVAGVSRNGEVQPIAQFCADAATAHVEWKAWLKNPPPHPPALAVAASSLIIPGTGQAILHESRSAKGYLIADLVILGAGALELSNEQRLSVLVPLGALAAIMRISSAAEAVRTTNRRRRRLREARAIADSPTQR